MNILHLPRDLIHIFFYCHILYLLHEFIQVCIPHSPIFFLNGNKLYYRRRLLSDPMQRDCSPTLGPTDMVGSDISVSASESSATSTTIRIRFLSRCLFPTHYFRIRHTVRNNVLPEVSDPLYLYYIIFSDITLFGKHTHFKFAVALTFHSSCTQF